MFFALPYVQILAFNSVNDKLSENCLWLSKILVFKMHYK